MSSPSPSAGGDTKQADQIHFKFCREWYVFLSCISHSASERKLTNNLHSSNLLYPKEDRVTNQLMFTCRTCHVGEPASSYCVYQNKLHSQVGDTAGVTQDVGSDPTVCLPGFCTLCGDEITCSVCGPDPNEAHVADDTDSLNSSDTDSRLSAGDSDTSWAFSG
jgi:DNA-directed RNA polymerase II subunit RPB9